MLRISVNRFSLTNKVNFHRNLSKTTIGQVETDF